MHNLGLIMVKHYQQHYMTILPFIFLLSVALLSKLFYPRKFQSSVHLVLMNSERLLRVFLLPLHKLFDDSQSSVTGGDLKVNNPALGSRSILFTIQGKLAFAFLPFDCDSRCRSVVSLLLYVSNKGPGILVDLIGGAQNYWLWSETLKVQLHLHSPQSTLTGNLYITLKSPRYPHNLHFPLLRSGK